MGKYRLQDIRNVRWNGKDMIAFKAYELKDNGYVFIGEFLAPLDTARENLINFIEE